MSQFLDAIANDPMNGRLIDVALKSGCNTDEISQRIQTALSSRIDTFEVILIRNAHFYRDTPNLRDYPVLIRECRNLLNVLERQGLLNYIGSLSRKPKYY